MQRPSGNRGQFGKLSWAHIGLCVACSMLFVSCTPPGDSSDVSAVPGGVDTAEAGSASELGSAEDKASYAVGYRVVAQVHEQFGDSLSIEAFLAAANDALESRPPRVSDDDARAALEVIAERQAVAAAAEAEVQSEAGNAFRATNGERDEVTTLPSGLQYEVLQVGDGDKPAATANVTTHYHGTLIDGTVFDSSVERGQPASFPLDRVIPGWTEALQLMPVGSKWRMVLPPELAYGVRGSPPKIAPGSTLIFEVELLSID